MHVKRNDTVMVMVGDDKGKKGKVLRTYPDKGTAIVEGIRFVKKHVKKGHPQAPQGGVIQKEASVRMSNLLPVCRSCGESSRISYKETTGRWVRACRKCGELLDVKEGGS